MTIQENGLCKKQQAIMITAARKAMDDGSPFEALSLAERVIDFSTANLITILSVFCTHPTIRLKNKALVALRRHLARCSRPLELIHAALWLRNPRRSYFLPEHLQELVDERRRDLEPNWNGIWENPGMKGSSAVIAKYKGKSPQEVYDPDVCIIAASQVRDWNSWLMRYLALGGNADDVRYLKIRIAKAATIWHKKLSPEVRRAIRVYCEKASVGDVRKLLRSITPIEKKTHKRRLTSLLARYALLVYCSCEKLEYDAEDWVHIARSSNFLNLPKLRKIAQRGLASVERTPSAQRVLEELIAIDGEIRVTDSAKEDIGPGGNPIWQSVYKLLPIDANARKILMSYARFETESA